MTAGMKRKSWRIIGLLGRRRINFTLDQLESVQEYLFQYNSKFFLISILIDLYVH